MSELIDDCVDQVQNKLRATFASLPEGHCISFTFDGWTSTTMTAFVAVTTHYITADWTLHRDLVSFAELDVSHSGENYGVHLYNILKEYQITAKVGDLYS